MTPRAPAGTRSLGLESVGALTRRPRAYLPIGVMGAMGAQFVLKTSMKTMAALAVGMKVMMPPMDAPCLSGPRANAKGPPVASR